MSVFRGDISPVKFDDFFADIESEADAHSQADLGGLEFFKDSHFVFVWYATTAVDNKNTDTVVIGF